MTPEELIASGNLELYVCGALSQAESEEVEQAMAQHGDVKQEVELIENTFILLGEAVAPPMQATTWTGIYEGITKKSRTQKTNWAAITGWAAAILFMGGIMWMLKKNNDLNKTIQVTTTQNTVLEGKNSEMQKQLTQNQATLDIIRSKDYRAYTLPGNQAVAPQAFAKVYLNKKDKVAYIDTQGLPPPPKGKVYQVWSLKMEPLSPSNVGLIAPENEVGNGIYKFIDFPEPEAFGITLEPEGGNETPTLSQLYTLGMVTI